MKIESMELFKVPPRWLFLKITTSSGLIGWGEPIVEGKADTVFAAVEELKPLVLGKNANNIEDIWQSLYRGGFYRGGPILTSAISGIEQALWDIKGKYYGIPVYEMLGGSVRDKIRVYSWVGGDKPNDVLMEAKSKFDQGYTAIKMNGTEELGWIDNYDKVDALLERVDVLKKEFGNKLDIAIDFHGRAHKSMAKILIHELQQYRIMFIEEPVLTDNEEVYKELRNQSSIPLAAGERNYTRWGFKNLITKGYVDIIQPDVSHVGGIFEAKKIASMAEAFDISVAPHCPLGPIALASCLQMDFCTPNAFIQEQSLGIHYNNGSDLLDYLVDKKVFHYSNGHVDKLEKPGLGIEVNEDYVRKMTKVSHNWRNPIWRIGDGSIVEW